ncbi:MAG: GNAT family N-acetyltransferase [Alphaproteobacteria bacterium]
MTSTIAETVLTTDRLTLRPFVQTDARAVQALCGNWNVARMLAVVPHPYPDGLAEDWIAGQADKRARGEEYVFAIEHDGEVIGAVGLERRSHTRRDIHEIGYWIAEEWWGQGLASEAAGRVVRYAFDELGVTRLTSGHFDENPASGKVLAKCGFRVTGKGMLPCAARGEAVPATLLALAGDTHEPAP